MRPDFQPSPRLNNRSRGSGGDIREGRQPVYLPEMWRELREHPGAAEAQAKSRGAASVQMLPV